MNFKERKDIINILITFLIVSYHYLKFYSFFSIKYIYILIFIVSILFAIKLLKEKNINIKIIFLGVLCIFITFIANDVNFLFFYILACIYKPYTYKQLIFHFVASSIVMYFSTIILYCLGILVQNGAVRNGLLRYSLGFGTPNEVFLYFLPITLGMYLLIKNKKNYLIINIILTLLLFYLSGSRNGFYCVILFYVYIIFLKNKRVIHKILNSFIYKYIYILLFCLTLYIAYNYGQEYSNNINIILNGRPYFWNLNITLYKLFTIFGNNILVYEYTLDNSYLVIMLECGIIVSLLYNYFVMKSQKLLNDDEKFIFLIYLIYGVFESNAFIGSINFIMPIILMRLINTKEKRNISDKKN